MKGSSYYTVELPIYFDFDSLLKNTAQAVSNHSRTNLYKRDVIRNLSDVNYRLFRNKDGKHAWRQLDLVHPLLYVLLVNQITKDRAWKTVLQRFEEFRQENTYIQCLSIPVVPGEDETPKALQISTWWHEIEQRSIEYALDYKYIMRTDVTDCYPSMYTRLIPLALHGEESNPRLIGNIIDAFLQDMQYGQKRGIPQGPILMDLIAEVVLGYADILLIRKLRDNKQGEYKILRYRDDYRIFTNNPSDGGRILRSLSEVMQDLGMKLHPQKTEVSNQVISSSIKYDKRTWISQKQLDRNPQKHLLIIHDYCTTHPNTGSLMRALTEFRDRLDNLTDFPEKYLQPLQLISIATDIAYRSPRTYPLVFSIVSQCLQYLDEEDRKKVLGRIRKKLSGISNASLKDIWLQRLSLKIDETILFEEPLCKLVSGSGNELWNNSWIKAEDVKKVVTADSIVDQDCIRDMPQVIDRKEVELFPSKYQ